MATITITDVSKSYGATPILHGISVDAREGEFLTLVGPSGCGKSTLLRMIAGLETVGEGVIQIGEQVVNHLRPKERDVALVFQNYALYPHMTVAENMGFSLRIGGAARADIQARVARAAEMLDLQSMLDRYPKQLSGGQRQRVAMGRALVRDPKVFLFDEPLSNLDAKLRVAMRAEIKALQQRLGTTTVYVTHDQVEAMTMADRIVVMRDGRIEQVGAPMDLYERPNNLFVAGFIGSPAMNFIPGTLKAGRIVTETGAELPMPAGLAARDGMRVIYGIRPEHLMIGSDGVRARVEVVEPTGPETHIRARLGDLFLTAVSRDREIPQPGDEIALLPDPERALAFDPDTQERLT